jgi:NAD(P)-dependent dehydrogenase (short-subunit alcohol dehydrogenase family)
MEKLLAGKVALVAGASRGAGRGIAVQLGAAGATVYVTGRTSRSQRSEMNRPETIEETAALVDEAGGRGIAIQADHLVPDEVRALVTRIEDEQGALHVLVNDIWGATRMEWGKSVWESSLDYGLQTLRLGIDTHAITGHFAIPLLIKTPGGLVVEVNDGTAEYNATHYRVSFFYDLVKTTVNRMAFALAHELAPYGATAVSLTPGWLRSEMMLDAYGVTESNWRDATMPRPISRFPKARLSWGGPSPRSHKIRTRRAGTNGPCRAGNWRRSMVSPISTAVSPTPGGIWSRFRTQANRRP